MRCTQHTEYTDSRHPFFVGTRQRGLKRHCHEIFVSGFFHESVYPPAPEYPIRIVSNFCENSRRYSQVKVHHQYQRHRWQIFHWCQRHQWQILPPVSLVLLIPVANLLPVTPAAYLPPVSKTMAANNGSEYLRKFSKKFETALMVYSGAWGNLIHEKNQKTKISWHCPF
jgi:hypothetical protein